MRLNVKVTGTRELHAKLGRLEDSVAASALAAATMAGALLVNNKAKEIVPVDTHTLQRSIHPELVESTRDHAYVDVGTDVKYAAAVEFGSYHAARSSIASHVTYKAFTIAPHPYLRPALDSEAAAVRGTIQSALKALIMGAAR